MLVELLVRLRVIQKRVRNRLEVLNLLDFQWRLIGASSEDGVVDGVALMRLIVR